MAPAATIPATRLVPLASLRQGQTAVIAETHLDVDDAALLKAMGLCTAAAIKIDYEPLAPLMTIEDALAPGAVTLFDGPTPGGAMLPVPLLRGDRLVDEPSAHRERGSGGAAPRLESADGCRRQNLDRDSEDNANVLRKMGVLSL